jgi:hypothetical protein
MLVSQRCATSRNAHSRNRSESRRIRSAVTTRYGGIDSLALPYAAGSVISSRGAGDRGAAARGVSWPECRSSADPGNHAKIMSGRADDVAVVPADAYEYRHLLEAAQP